MLYATRWFELLVGRGGVNECCVESDLELVLQHGDALADRKSHACSIADGHGPSDRCAHHVDSYGLANGYAHHIESYGLTDRCADRVFDFSAVC